MRAGSAIVVALALLIAGAMPVTAQQDPVASMYERLGDEGYEVTGSWDTLLGRIRIVAENDEGDIREIVLDPRTGAVLRDVLGASPGENLLDRFLLDERGPTRGLRLP